MSGVVARGPAIANPCVQAWKLFRPVARVLRFDLGLVVQDYVEQGVADFQCSVVFDIAQFADSVHEKAHARSCRADHLGIKRGLASLPQHDPPFLDHTRALFARIEQLVDQVFLNSAVPKNQPLEQPSCIITPSDIEPLRGLIALSLSRSRVTSLEPPWGLPVLRSLDLSGAEVANFEQLRELTALEQLNLSGRRVENLDPLKGLTTLNSLDLSGTWIANLDQLKALTPLRSLDLSLTQVAGLESLK